MGIIDDIRKHAPIFEYNPDRFMEEVEKAAAFYGANIIIERDFKPKVESNDWLQDYKRRGQVTEDAECEVLETKINDNNPS